MYISSRDNHPKVTASKAIQLGMVPKGGLFVPNIIPELSKEELKSFSTY
jgi:threonine synthase